MNSRGGDGAEVIYALRNNANLANLIAQEIQREGQNIRNVYQRRLPSDTSKDYYFIHRNTGVTQPVIVEYGFLDSTGDDVNQLKNEYPRYVDAVVRAVLEYIGKTSSSNGTYTVQSGDSLWSIAKKFGTTVDELKKLNNLTSNSLSVGTVLKVPQTTPETPETPNNTGIYVVKSGDSLYKIAQTYNTTVDALMRLNNLTSTNLSVGQQLRIPGSSETEPPSSNENYITYTVKPGDSLYSIARNYNTTADALIQFNNLSSNLLNIGQVLRIPVTAQNPPPTPPTENTSTYTVRAGDSLYKIANAYNTTVDTLMRLNNLNSIALQVGQVLKVPTEDGNNPSEVRYTVKSGDSLYKIANAYNTTVDAIKRRNNLTSNNLSVGQVLIIG